LLRSIRFSYGLRVHRTQHTSNAQEDFFPSGYQQISRRTGDFLAQSQTPAHLNHIRQKADGHVSAVSGFIGDERGADFVEYAFIVSMVAIATATLITPLVPTMIQVFNTLASKVKP
jgi:Flp pilus assembly pilin Flp